MERIDQLERYQKEKPEFFEQIAALEKKHGTPILSKMRARQYDFDSFTGVMAEMDFGLFLDTFCESLVFEPNINGLTPDWLATVEGRKVIVEVARLKDTNDVEQQSLQDQEAGRIVWRTMRMRPERVFGNTIMGKLNKYGDLVQTINYPFIIGIYNRHLSGVHADDAGVLFQGNMIEEQISQQKDADPEKVKEFLLKLNLMRRLVSGILWLDQPSLNPVTLKPYEKEFIYWGNDRAINAIGENCALQAIQGKL